MGGDHRGLVLVLGVLILLVLLGPLLGGGMMGPGMMGSGGPGGPIGAGGWAWGLAMALGALSMLAFWGALIVGVVLLVRWLAGTTARSGAAPHESPLDILRRRYAAGEITREEYEQMRQVLER